MRPFDSYPKDEHELRSPPRNPYNCRHGWGLDIQQRTGQTRCAYCGVSLVDDYYHWLLMCVDHVVPSREAQRLNIPPDLANGLVNHVLACSGCNGFHNRHVIAAEPQKEWTLDQFIDLRDTTFRNRKASVGERRAEEMAFFDRHPWNQPKLTIISEDSRHHPECQAQGTRHRDSEGRLTTKS